MAFAPTVFYALFERFRESAVRRLDADECSDEKTRRRERGSREVAVRPLEVYYRLVLEESYVHEIGSIY